MALITCPNCGEQVSDKAKTCIHCGANLIPEEKQICQECGAEIEPESDVCPKCGCPVKIEETAQKVEVTGVYINKKSKNIILILVIAVAAAIVIALAGVQVHKKNVAAAEAKAAEEQAKNYQSNLIEAYNNMISTACLPVLVTTGDASSYTIFAYFPVSFPVGTAANFNTSTSITLKSYSTLRSMPICSFRCISIISLIVPSF